MILKKPTKTGVEPRSFVVMTKTSVRQRKYLYIFTNFTKRVDISIFAC